MTKMKEIKDDRPVILLAEFSSSIDIFRLAIGSIGWLIQSKSAYIKYLEKYKYIVEMETSVTNKVLKIDKTILNLIDGKDENHLIQKSIREIAKLIIIDMKDITDSLPEFPIIRTSTTYKILRLLRNSSAHNNKVYFDKGKYREKVLNQLPYKWRNKTIDTSSENKDIFNDLHFSPADIFVIAEELSLLVLNIRNKVTGNS